MASFIFQSVEIYIARSTDSLQVVFFQIQALKVIKKFLVEGAQTEIKTFKMAAPTFGSESVLICVSVLIYNDNEHKCLLRLTQETNGWWLPFESGPVLLKPFSAIAKEVVEVGKQKLCSAQPLLAYRPIVP